MNIYAKLEQIQQTLDAPKNQFNSFGKYKYRSCEDILEGLKPLLAEHKCVVTLADDLVLIGDRYYVKATATLVDAETSESTSIVSYAREEESKKGMDGSQVTGASSSYARKYALNGLFAIDDSKDSDSTNKGGKDKEDTITPAPAPPPPPPTTTTPKTNGISEPQRKMLYARATTVGLTMEQLKIITADMHEAKKISSPSSKDWTRKDFDAVLKAVDEWKEVANA
jgi:hypothetical protein